ncbi:MAG: S26 family signal peptidase [Planctomycetota bacterium]
MSLSMVRDAIAVAAIAVLAFQALRRWCGDRYIVPSGSMQPVLFGDPRRGDIVFVDKLVSASTRHRHDLVVVQQPGEPGQQLVKRIAASGDDADACCIDIRAGDIWLGGNLQRMQREVKDPLLARPMRVLWAAWSSKMRNPMLDVLVAREANGTLSLSPLEVNAEAARRLFGAQARENRRQDPAGRVVPDGFVGTSKSVDASYVAVTGVRGLTGEDVGVADCGMDLELQDATSDLLCTIDARSEALTFHWRPSTGRVELWRNGEDVESAELPPFPGGVRRIEFGWLDDRAFFIVDGRREAMFVVARRSEWAAREPELPQGPRSYVHVAAIGREPVLIRSLSVYHDVFAYREPVAGLPGQPGSWPRYVEPGMWFLLGDSAFDSRDSRQFDAVSSSSFIGRPLCVIGPWPRCRWLTP